MLSDRFFCIQPPKCLCSSLVIYFIALLLDLFLASDSWAWNHWSWVNLGTAPPLFSFMVLSGHDRMLWCINILWSCVFVRGCFVVMYVSIIFSMSWFLLDSGVINFLGVLERGLGWFLCIRCALLSVTSFCSLLLDDVNEWLWLRSILVGVICLMCILRGIYFSLGYLWVSVSLGM